MKFLLENKSDPLLAVIRYWQVDVLRSNIRRSVFVFYQVVLTGPQGFSWTEIYFEHFVQAAPILLGHLEIF